MIISGSLKKGAVITDKDDLDSLLEKSNIQIEGVDTCKCGETWGTDPNEVCPYCSPLLSFSERFKNKLQNKRR